MKAPVRTYKATYASIGIFAITALWFYGCSPQQYRLDYTNFYSSSLERDMNYSVYLPPGWDGQEPLPLVVFLHGGGDDEKAIEEHGAAQTFDSWIRSGKLDPFIMVSPDGNKGFWTNWYDGSNQYEDYVVQDVIPRVRKAYPLLGGRENTHLMGISMGGAGTIFMAYNNKNVFGSAAVLSAPLFNDDQVRKLYKGFFMRRIMGIERIFGPLDPERIARKSLYQNIRRTEDLEGMQLLLGYGVDDSDTIRETTEEYHRYLVSKNVDHRYLVYQGDHKWYDWNKVFPAILCHHFSADDQCQLETDPFYKISRFN